MRDGQSCNIILVGSYEEGAILLYELQILYKGAKHLISLRYSALRAISKMLPNCQVKFPEPHHITSFISSLTGSEEFLKKRYSQLSLYFEAINKITELENSLGVRIMLFGNISNIPMIDLEFTPPLAPTIKGKKLMAKIVDSQIS